MKRTGFLDRAPAGPVRNISPNGDARDGGAQSPWSNGFMPKGNLPAGSGTNTNSNANRSGEG